MPARRRRCARRGACRRNHGARALGAGSGGGRGAPRDHRHPPISALLLKPEPLPARPAQARGPGGRRRHLIGMSVREPGVAAPDLAPEGLPRLLANAADFMSIATTPTWFSCRWNARCSTRRQPRSDREHAARERATVLKASTAPASSVLDVALRPCGRHAPAFLIFAALAGTRSSRCPTRQGGRFLEDLGLPARPIKLVKPAGDRAHRRVVGPPARHRGQAAEGGAPLQERAQQTHPSWSICLKGKAPPCQPSSGLSVRPRIALPPRKAVVAADTDVWWSAAARRAWARR